MKFKHYIAIIACALGLIWFLAALDVDSDVSGWITTIFVVVLIAVIMIKNDVKICDSHSNFSRNGDEKCIELHSRAKDNKNYISIKRFQQQYMKDHEAQLVYTGATVGGVHTGGFHVEEAYSSFHGGSITDRFYFWVSDGNKKGFILEKVVLDKKLVDEAEQHPVVSRFLNGNTLVLQYDNENTKLTEEESAIHNRAAKNRDVSTMVNISLRAITEKKLRKDDAKAVLDWMCGL